MKFQWLTTTEVPVPAEFPLSLTLMFPSRQELGTQAFSLCDSDVNT